MHTFSLKFKGKGKSKKKIEKESNLMKTSSHWVIKLCFFPHFVSMLFLLIMGVLNFVPS